MRPKVITLCEATWKLAMEKENFSEWVRAQLLATDEVTIQEVKDAHAFKEEHGRFPLWFGGEE